MYPIDYSPLVLRLINAGDEIKLAANCQDESAISNFHAAQLNLAYSACNSLLVIAQCLLTMATRDEPEPINSH